MSGNISSDQVDYLNIFKRYNSFGILVSFLLFVAGIMTLITVWKINNTNNVPTCVNGSTDKDILITSVSFLSFCCVAMIFIMYNNYNSIIFPTKTQKGITITLVFQFFIFLGTVAGLGMVSNSLRTINFNATNNNCISNTDLSAVKIGSIIVCCLSLLFLAIEVYNVERTNCLIPK